MDRTLSQNAFSISDNVTWIMGGHSLKAGGLYTRNSANDGFGIGVNFRGRYRFNGARTGNAFTDFLLGLPLDAADQVTTRGPLEGYSNDFALLRAGRLAGQPGPDRVPGPALRDRRASGTRRAT